RRGWLALTLGGLAWGPASVQAQQAAPDPITGQGTVVRLQNSYITLVYGVSGTPAVTVPTAPDSNFSGRWGIATVFGDPDTSLDDNRAAFAWNHLSYQVEPQLAAQATRWYRLGEAADGTYVDPPTADTASGVITAKWNTTGTITVNQVRPGSGTGAAGGVTEPVGIQVEVKLFLLRDMVRAEYKFINTAGVIRRVRARSFMDPDDTGSWIVGRQRVEFESEFTGGNVPDEWRYYLPLSAPELVVRGILGRFGATQPNRFVIGETNPLCSGPWNYIINPTLRIDGNPDPNNEACQAYYDTFTLLPNQSRTIITYAGLGNAECEPTPPYVLAVQSRRTLGFVLGDDPNTANPEPSYASPQTFTIRAFIYNVAQYDITNASVFLSLPKGLSLVSGQPAVRQIGTVLRQSEVPASWDVQVDPGVSGVLTYTVTSSGVPVPSKTVAGTIEVPAQASRTFQPGLALISIPFQFSNPDTPVALNLPPDRIRLARWDPSTKKYAFYPDSLVSTVQPGVGYWFRPDTVTTLALQGATPVARTLTSNYVVPVKAGWNIIGAPFVYTVPWANTRVSDGQQVLTLSEAAAAGWIRPTLFSYNPTSNSYEFTSLQEATLEPWQGYWLRALRDVFLLIPPVSTPGATVLAPDQRAAQDGWRVQLVARAGWAADTCNFVGVSRGVSDGCGLEDVEEPPVPHQGYVSLRFVHDDWGRNSGAFTQDIRDADVTGGKVWEFEVHTDRAGEEVALTWPSLNARLPRTLDATLEDVASGRRVNLRVQGHYRFAAPQDGVRRFRLTVSPRAAGRLAITEVHVEPAAGRAGGRVISYQLSQDATAQVRIVSPTGRVIREVAAQAPAQAGRNSVFWDGSDARGARLTSGLVLVEITACGSEGESVRQVRPCVLSR
ncbi:MAG: hypothetical protein QHJ73_01905, partial [Armatimonadota bacterium]|nr:hypothetical protein [Armatimonadota bacterium]